MLNIKSASQKPHDDAHAFIRLHLGSVVARGASHIRSKRALSLRSGIEEVRQEYEVEHGEETVMAFLECVESWLVERGNSVAAAALRNYLDVDLGPEIALRRADAAAAAFSPMECGENAVVMTMDEPSAETPATLDELVGESLFVSSRAKEAPAPTRDREALSMMQRRGLVPAA